MDVLPANRYLFHLLLFTCSFFPHAFKATAYTGFRQVTFNWPNPTSFYHIVQIFLLGRRLRRLFGARYSLTDSGSKPKTAGELA